MSYFECPKCKSKNVSTERRPNGVSICQECEHSALTKDFIQTIEVEAHYEAIERITAACNSQISELELRLNDAANLKAEVLTIVDRTAYKMKISELTQANLKLVEALKKIAENEHTMDDTTYCYLASKTLKELEIK